jgi:hypothetical protein
MIVNEKEESPRWALLSIIDDEFRDWLLAQGKTKWTIRKKDCNPFQKIQSRANTDDTSQQLDSIA